MLEMVFKLSNSQASGTSVPHHKHSSYFCAPLSNDSSGGMQLLPPKSAQQGLGQSGLLQPQPLPSAQLQPLRGPQGSGQGRGTGTEQDVVVSKETLERWRAAYAEMSNDAMVRCWKVGGGEAGGNKAVFGGSRVC